MLSFTQRIWGGNGTSQEPPNGGTPIVLTASRAECSNYSGDPFSAFLAVFPEKVLPKALMRDEWFHPPDHNPDGTARFAPYGLRKVEAVAKDHFGEDSVAVVHPDNLHKFVGPKTRVVGISSMDPMGLAYVSVTYNSMIAVGGESVDAREFRRLMEDPIFKKYDPTVIVGGAGTWQIRDAGMVEEYGIDVLVHGESEQTIPELFRKALDGEELPRDVRGRRLPHEEIPTIRGATTLGQIEITRGCGRACQFCSPTLRDRWSFPLDHIMKEVAVNVENGSDSIFVTTEDFMLYKCGRRFEPNGDALYELFKSIADHPGVEFIHLSHINITPVVQDPSTIERISPVLLEKTRYTPEFRSNYKEPFISVLYGLETGSIEIIRRYLKGKVFPFRPEDYHDIVLKGTEILNDNGWRPMATIMTGWPKETAADVEQTLRLIQKMRDIDLKVFLTPLLFIPFELTRMAGESVMPLEHLTDEQWDLIAECWKFNIDVWDPGKRPLFSAAALLTYALYYRWKHGKKVFKPIMTLAGLRPFFGGTSRRCDPRICGEDLSRREIPEVPGMPVPVGGGKFMGIDGPRTDDVPPEYIH